MTESGQTLQRERVFPQQGTRTGRGAGSEDCEEIDINGRTRSAAKRKAGNEQRVRRRTCQLFIKKKKQKKIVHKMAAHFCT